MKRAEAQVVCSPLFQFYESANHINNINAVEYLLYSILTDQMMSKIRLLISLIIDNQDKLKEEKIS